MKGGTSTIVLGLYIVHIKMAILRFTDCLSAAVPRPLFILIHLMLKATLQVGTTVVPIL